MVTTLAAGTEDTPSLADVKENLRSEELRQKQVDTVPEDVQGRALVNSGFAEQHASCVTIESNLFVNFKELSNTQEVTLGDGRTLDGTGLEQ